MTVTFLDKALAQQSMDRLEQLPRKRAPEVGPRQTYIVRQVVQRPIWRDAEGAQQLHIK